MVKLIRKGDRWNWGDLNDERFHCDESRVSRWVTSVNNTSFDSLTKSVNEEGKDLHVRVISKSKKRPRLVEDEGEDAASRRRTESNREAEEQSTLRSKKEKELAKLRGRKYGIVVKDRSSSRIIRPKERNRLNHLDKSHRISGRWSDVEDNLDLPSDKKKRKIQGTRQKEKFHYESLLDSHRYGENRRGPIVISGNPQGLFGKGASSGQHIVYEKRLSNQGTKEMASLDAGVRVLPEAEPMDTWPDEDERSSNQDSSSNKTLVRLEENLKKAIQSIKWIKKKASMQERSGLVEQKGSSSNDNDDSHSAYSRAQQVERKAETHLGDVSYSTEAESDKFEPLCLETLQEQIQTTVMPPPDTTSEANYEGLPPLFAFNGNKPYQHNNAWRGQHNRVEEGWQDIEQRLEQSGGPDLRSGKPLEYVIDQMSQENRLQDCQKRSWEIVPAEKVSIDWQSHDDQQHLACISPYDCYTSPHRCFKGYSLHHEEEPRNVNKFEQRWLGDDNGEEPPEQCMEDDTDLQHEPQHSQIDHRMYGNIDQDSMEQDDFEPCSAAMNQEWFDNDQAFDQEEYQRDPSCFGQDLYDLDYDGNEEEQKECSGVEGVREAAQPTKADMINFWKPQDF